MFFNQMYKRGAGASDLPDTAQVKLEDVKALFTQQRGFLDNFFEKVGSGERLGERAGGLRGDARVTINIHRCHLRHTELKRTTIL